MLCRNRSGENEIDARVVFPGAKKNSVLKRDHEKDFVICFFLFHYSSVCLSRSWSTISTRSTLSSRFLSFRTNPGQHRCCPRGSGWKLLLPRRAQSPPGMSVSIIHVGGLEDRGGRGKKCHHFELLWGLNCTSVFFFILLGGKVVWKIMAPLR